MDYILYLGFGLVLVAVGYFAGTSQERKHFESINKREEALKSILVMASGHPPDFSQKAYRTELVCGSVVIAMDRFKLVMGSIIQLMGGRIKYYETLVERARREAVLRMKEEAGGKSAHMVFNVKFSTAGIINTPNGQPGGCVEVIAYGTAIIYM
ncbi:YbjQ family protein [Deltaproteobacteria bacterium OttesenSCG-928-K17]|nr:YbjQ family protein [Deltaproteobacteria bacterium OttesenSCG-928-K17]